MDTTNSLVLSHSRYAAYSERKGIEFIFPTPPELIGANLSLILLLILFYILVLLMVVSVLNYLFWLASVPLLLGYDFTFT